MTFYELRGRDTEKVSCFNSFLNFKVKSNELKGRKKRNLTFVNRYFTYYYYLTVPHNFEGNILKKKKNLLNSHKTFFKGRNDT